MQSKNQWDHFHTVNNVVRTIYYRCMARSFFIFHCARNFIHFRSTHKAVKNWPSHPRSSRSFLINNCIFFIFLADKCLLNWRDFNGHCPNTILRYNRNGSTYIRMHVFFTDLFTCMYLRVSLQWMFFTSSSSVCVCVCVCVCARESSNA